MRVDERAVKWAGKFAVRGVRLVGVGLRCVVCGGMESGRVRTGYEVGGWGERHGALCESGRCGKNLCNRLVAEQKRLQWVETNVVA